MHFPQHHSLLMIFLFLKDLFSCDDYDGTRIIISDPSSCETACTTDVFTHDDTTDTLSQLKKIVLKTCESDDVFLFLFTLFIIVLYLLISLRKCCILFINNVKEVFSNKILFVFKVYI